MSTTSFKTDPKTGHIVIEFLLSPTLGPTSQRLITAPWGQVESYFHVGIDSTASYIQGFAMRFDPAFLVEIKSKLGTNGTFNKSQSYWFGPNSNHISIEAIVAKSDDRDVLDISGQVMVAERDDFLEFAGVWSDAILVFDTQPDSVNIHTVSKWVFDLVYLLNVMQVWQD